MKAISCAKKTENSLLIILSPVLLMVFSILIDNYSSIAVYAQLGNSTILSIDGVEERLEEQEEEEEDHEHKNNNNSNNNDVPFALPIPFP